ncbi:MAG: cyanophycin synthetase [Patescibacteria group bacterium]
MNLREITSAHLVGIGGINMSAVAKLLQKTECNTKQRICVTGSDVATNEQAEILKKIGIAVTIGHDAKNVPPNCDLLIYSSAVPPSNPEREDARRRGIREMTNFEFLGEWFADSRVILVTGTHGKSTTTAMLGLILERAELDPTVIVGSVVSSFSDGNLRLGKSDLVVIEGDEYAKHFLVFHPYGLIVNNIELDHTDIFPTIENMKAAFRELMDQVVPGGFIVANMEDAHVRDVTTSTSAHRIIPFATDSFHLNVPGRFNQMNAAGAATVARALGASDDAIVAALESFTGIWRRFEFLGEKNSARIYSDYAHHPTAVAATLEAARDGRRESGAVRRTLLCFQPHHRNRTKHLFLDFVPSFDLADALVVCEIYDVAGRDASQDADISSKDLVDAIVRHDADRGASRVVEYAADPNAAVRRITDLATQGDLVLVMGAGDIDAAIRKTIRMNHASTSL